MTATIARPPVAAAASASRPGAGRIVALDVLRGVAILLVLGRHLSDPRNANPWPLSPLLDAWQRVGWMGVDLFFVLSGFLVSGLLFREYERYGELRIGRFLARRALKIYPAFYTFLLITTLVLALRGYRLSTAALVTEGLFLTNYGPAFWPHTWSLAVEEHFYLLLPLALGVLFALQRVRYHRDRPLLPVVLCWAALAGAAMALRALTVMTRGAYVEKAFLFPSHLRFDALLFGVLLAYLAHTRPVQLAGLVRRWRWVMVAAGLAGILPCALWPMTVPLVYVGGLTTLYLGMGLLLLAGLYGFPDWPRTARLLKPLAAIGVYSYSLYLWHIPARWAAPVVVKWLGAPGWYAAELWVYVALSLLLGIGMARALELPVLRLRDRWLPSRSAGAVTPQTWPGSSAAAAHHPRRSPETPARLPG